MDPPITKELRSAMQGSEGKQFKGILIYVGKTPEIQPAGSVRPTLLHLATWTPGTMGVSGKFGISFFHFKDNKKVMMWSQLLCERLAYDLSWLSHRKFDAHVHCST